MLPEYSGYTLTKELLTDEVVNTAMERKDVPETVQTETVKDALYDYMSYSSVSDEHMTALEAELAGTVDYDAFSFLEVIALEVADILGGEEMVAYRDANVHAVDVSAAMAAVGVEAAPTDMATLVASYVVMGKAELVNKEGAGLLIEQAGLTVAQVVNVATYMRNNK